MALGHGMILHDGRFVTSQTSRQPRIGFAGSRTPRLYPRDGCSLLRGSRVRPKPATRTSRPQYFISDTSRRIRDGIGCRISTGELEKVTRARQTLAHTHGNGRGSVGSDGLSSRDGESVWGGESAQNPDRRERPKRGRSLHRIGSPGHGDHPEKRGPSSRLERRGSCVTGGELSIVSPKVVSGSERQGFISWFI